MVSPKRQSLHHGWSNSTPSLKVRYSLAVTLLIVRALSAIQLKMKVRRVVCSTPFLLVPRPYDAIVEFPRRSTISLVLEALYINYRARYTHFGSSVK